MNNNNQSKLVDRWIAPAITGVVVALASVVFNSTSQASPDIKVVSTQRDNIFEYRNNIFQAKNKYIVSRLRLNIANYGEQVERNLVVTFAPPNGARIVSINGFTHFQVRKDLVWREIGLSGVKRLGRLDILEIRLPQLPPKTTVSINIDFAIESQRSVPHPQPVVRVFGENGPANIKNQ